MHLRALAFALLLVLTACDWLSLASNALTYETLRSGDAGNVVALGTVALDGAGFTSGGAKPANFPIEGAQLDNSTFVVAFGGGVARITVARDGLPSLDRILDVGGPAVNVDALRDTAAVAVAGAPEGSAIVLVDLTGEPRVIKRIALPAGTIPGGVALTSRSVIVAARRQGVLALQR